MPRLSCNVSALCIAIIIHYLMHNHAGLSKMPGFWASEKTPDLGDLEPRPGAAARAVARAGYPQVVSPQASRRGRRRVGQRKIAGCAGERAKSP